MNIFDVLFPPMCVSCGRFGSYICTSCKKLLKPIAYTDMICPECERASLEGLTHPGCKKRGCLDGLVSFFHYKGVMQQAIKELKYRFVRNMARFILEDVSLSQYSLLKTSLSDPVTLVPIPLHPARLRYRGFNQAETIAVVLSEKLRVAVDTQILVRVRNTSIQADFVHKQQRQENMNHAFKSRIALEGTVILVDDVFTTGATMKSACLVCKQAGAQRVIGVTIAR